MHRQANQLCLCTYASDQFAGRLAGGRHALAAANDVTWKLMAEIGVGDFFSEIVWTQGQLNFLAGGASQHLVDHVGVVPVVTQ